MAYRSKKQSWSNYGYYEYVPVAEKKAKALKELEKLKKKNPGIKPVSVTGRKMAKTWWGEAWNKNLESYSDYANRLGRGRSYVRQGSVLDLQIQPGEITALVQGSRAKPYQINIAIQPLAQNIWDGLVKACEGKIDSLQELLEGKFPKGLAELFQAKGGGLFPSPREIRLSCSCPDYAVMCKHVAASLYGAGVRLDENPSLFFLLRGVNVGELISKAIAQKSETLLGKGGSKSRRAIASADLGDMFGIELDEKLSEKTPDEEISKSGSKKDQTARIIQKTSEPQQPVKKRGRPRKNPIAVED